VAVEDEEMIRDAITMSSLTGVCACPEGGACLSALRRLRTTGFGFDAELLLRARAAGYRIAEVPVNWADQAGSKVGVVRHGPGMLWQIAKAGWRVGRGS